MTQQPPGGVEEAPTGAVRVWLLDSDGTPSGEAWWDRTLRIDGRFEPVDPCTVGGRRVLLNLLGGSGRSWRRIHGHRPYPLALEAWTYVEALDQWMHVLCPRVHVDDVGDRPPEGGRPVLTWVAQPNPNWPDGDKATESAIVWRRYAEPPLDPLIPLGLGGDPATP